MVVTGGAVLSVKAARRPSTARHRAPTGRAAAGTSPTIPLPRVPLQDTEPPPATEPLPLPYPVWPGDPVRPGWVDAPGRAATTTISLRDWYEDPYAGNVTVPHDPWQALYVSVARLRQRDRGSA
jgi:hypothetical protein